MAFLERVVERVAVNKWDVVKALEKEWDALEAKLDGFPKKRRLQGFAGPYGWDYFVFEREWESLAAYEAAYDRLWKAPEVKALAEAGLGIKTDSRTEIYAVLE